MQYERWLIPIYKSGRQSDTSTTFQLTWYPRIDRRSKVLQNLTDYSLGKDV